MKLLHEGSQVYRPGWTHLYLFTLQKVLARNILELDRQFWQSRGWFEADFFFPARLGLIKPALFRLLYWILARVIVRREPRD